MYSNESSAAILSFVESEGLREKKKSPFGLKEKKFGKITFVHLFPVVKRTRATLLPKEKQTWQQPLGEHPHPKSFPW